MVSCGADVAVVTKDQRNAAHIAVMYAGVEMLSAVLSNNKDLLRKPAGVSSFPYNK